MEVKFKTLRAVFTVVPTSIAVAIIDYGYLWRESYWDCYFSFQKKLSIPLPPKHIGYGGKHRPLDIKMSSASDTRTCCQVRVGVRVRPLASKEIQQGGKLSLSIHPPASIQIASQKTSFTYDVVFDSQTDQDSLYNSVSDSLLASFVEGYNATVR